MLTINSNCENTEKKEKNPIKCNGIQLDHSQSAWFGVDYLVLSFKGSPLLKGQKSLKLDMHQYGNRTYKKMVDVYYSPSTDKPKEKYFIMNFEPKSEIIESDLVQIKLENHLFYTRSMQDLKKEIETITELLGISFHSCSRLDLALDVHGNSHGISTSLKQLNQGTLLFAGRPKEIAFYTKVKKGVVTCNGVGIGKKSAYKYCRIYNKTNEILIGKNSKPYILDAWRSVGFDIESMNILNYDYATNGQKKNFNRDTNNDIWRYEYQLNRAYLAKLKDFTFDNIFDKHFLFSLLEEAKKNHSELKYNTGKSEINKEKDFLMLDFKKIAQRIKAVRGVIERLPRTIKDTFIGTQRLIKGNLRNYFSYGQKLEFLMPIRQILDSNPILKDWYYSKVSNYIYEFKKDTKINFINENLYNSHFELYC
ncbi:hypothetical protein [Joostella sp.]|uniref:hypothetical protein n=1 Tax=Joostella sp. TaxID=2231138 RepID=UPI003A8D190F